jgi:hypothetical protein
MPALEGMLHLLNEAIEMEIGAVLWEFISSEEHQSGETPEARENYIERPMCKGRTHDRQGHS